MAVNRAPLRFIVLNQSGQDVNECSQCDSCDCEFAPSWDLRPCEVLQLIRNNDERALTCKTIWTCQDCQECYVTCPSEIDFGAVAYALRQEAQKRGIISSATEP